VGQFFRLGLRREVLAGAALDPGLLTPQAAT
jgi:hypothetical protein